jgi:hypothetical protein
MLNYLFNQKLQKDLNTLEHIKFKINISKRSHQEENQRFPKN